MAASRRARAVAAARQAAEDAAWLRRAKAFVGLMRNQAGIPVRQPAHAAPPFRAIPLNWFGIAQLVNSDQGLFQIAVPVNWSASLVSPSGGSQALTDAAFNASNGIDAWNATAYAEDAAEPFPDGFLGFITQATCAVTVRSTNIDDVPPVRNARWSWRIDGQYVPGYRWALPQQDLNEPTVAVGGFAQGAVLAPGGGTLVNMLGCPVQVRPGQRTFVEAGMYAPGATSVRRLIVWRLSGYAIPTKSGADRTILDTLTD